jgi:putative IMPACT (imprinted ancient) family translation regulator
VVGEALDAVGTRTRRRLRLATVTVGHQRAGKVENDLGATGHAVRDVSYGESVTIEVGLPEAEVGAFRAWLADTTAGTARLDLGGETYDDA